MVVGAWGLLSLEIVDAFFGLRLFGCFSEFVEVDAGHCEEGYVEEPFGGRC